ncbi:hypothetical protein GCM10010399_93780 [Dactylosporangium fulvum]|uniref:Uncharacterized protein n=1 Tax=Dactylosporangium fulvum TaxID=53359 RepID=A0ABY5VLJ3_9ACTN|nr:hypothetical protein [Dactylosporangium fulvum]UWP78408.1 hypothetical protein Dfulv_24780 [Dactylosporangium fulvum]
MRLAHDGPEDERAAGLSRLFPAEHVVLLSPGDRDEWYSANPAYADCRPGRSSGWAPASACRPCSTSGAASTREVTSASA